MMNKRTILAYSILCCLLILMALVFSQFIPQELGRGKTLDYRSLYILQDILFGIGFIIFLALIIVISGKRQKLLELGLKVVDATRLNFLTLLKIQTVLLICAYLFFEFFLLTYVSFPVPFRYLFLVISLICLAAWFFFRFSYKEENSSRGTKFRKIKAGWQAWNTTQRRVFIILSSLCIIVFGLLFPVNSLPEDNLLKGTNPDEQTIYPDSASRILTMGNTFGETVNNIITGPYWWYGYPFHIISAIPLVIPRIIYGNSFSGHIALNILLLRQFVSVLPMLAALVMLVYLATEFKSYWFSIGLFIVSLFIPAVVNNNVRFWHPDGIICLLSVLTIYFLKKDSLKFGKYFFLAAVTCALSAAIKILGIFFFTAILGYLVAGVVKKTITTRQGFIKGLLFIGTMVLVFVMTNPDWLVPWIAKRNIASILDQQQKIQFGFGNLDTEGVYKTGLGNYLKYLDINFMHPITFFIGLGAALAGSFWGQKKYLLRLILAWCIPGLAFLIFYSAIKSPQYSMPFIIFLYAAIAALPESLNFAFFTKHVSWDSKKVIQKSIVVFVVLIGILQLLYNIFFKLSWLYKVISKI